VNELALIFKALSDKNRLRILKMLEVKPLCVCEIREVLDLAISTTSKHLSILKFAGLIFEQKENKWINYHLNIATQKKYVREILPLMKRWLNEDHTIKNDIAKAKETDRIKICK